MQPAPPCSVPGLLVADASVWATSLLGVVVRRVICGFYLFIPPGFVTIWDSKIPHRPAGERVSCCLETSPLSRLPSQDGSPSLSLCLSFYLLYFVLPPFKDNRLPFWVPGVLCQLSEVALWNLISIQMIFWWICGGESGLPILFLRHPILTLQKCINLKKKKKKKTRIMASGPITSL